MQYLKFWLKVISLLLLWGILLPRLVHAQPGSPDPAFGGGDGFATTSFFADGHAASTAVAVQPNGRIVISGGTWIPNGTENESIAIARFMPNGSLDPTFSVDGKATVSLPGLAISNSDILVLPDGKIMCAGSAWNNWERFFALVRFNADGTPDSSFDGDGILITQVGNNSQGAASIALQSDGKIVIAGYANLTGYNEFAVLRYKSNGTLDNSFGGGDGIVTTPVGESYSSAREVLIQPDGKIVTAGYAVLNGFEDFAVLRYNSNGTLDASFGGGDGIAMASFSNKDDRAYDAALQPDGKIVLAGYARSGADNDNEIAVARFTANGMPDFSFSGDGLATAHLSNYSEDARAVVVQPDGKILLGGRQGAGPNERSDFALVRLETNGLPDNTFSGDGVATLKVSPNDSNVEAMALQPDGKVVAAGVSWNGQAQRNSFLVARFLTGVTVDTNTPTVFSGKTTLYPNPVRDQATLEYELSSNEEVEINLYDIQGRFIQKLLPSTPKLAGKHAETILFTHELPAGTYFLTIKTASGNTAIEVIF